MTLRSRELAWLAAGVLLVAGVALALRFGTEVRERDLLFDEVFLRGPVTDLAVRGWSFETAIDFEESKGPALVWTYALFGRLVGLELNALRALSVAFFVAGVVPLLLLARRCGLDGPRLVAVALCYALMPQNAVLGQLFMSEPSFVFGATWLAWIFVWGFDAEATPRRTAVAASLFALVLSVLLHHRVHVTALAAAVVLVAFERDRLRSWPWVVACVAAGASRVPLLVHWGGLVSPSFQASHTLGIAPENLTYLAAALVPWTGAFLLAAPVGADRRRAWIGIGAGALVGALLVAAALPPPTEVHSGGRVIGRFLGLVSTATREATDSLRLQAVMIGALAVVGAASAGALAEIGWRRPPSDARAMVLRLAFWTLVAGCGTYVFTLGSVFDRYVLGWGVLCPLAWVLALPRAVLAAQWALLAVMLVVNASRHLS